MRRIRGEMTDMARKSGNIEPCKPGEGMAVLYQSPTYSREVYRGLAAIKVGDVRFVNENLDEKWDIEDGRIVAVTLGDTRYEKVETCTMERVYDGTFNYDYRCSNCGKTHNAPRANERCPRCGAYVEEVR